MAAQAITTSIDFIYTLLLFFPPSNVRNLSTHGLARQSMRAARLRRHSKSVWMESAFMRATLDAFAGLRYCGAVSYRESLSSLRPAKMEFINYVHKISSRAGGQSAAPAGAVAGSRGARGRP